VKYFNSLDVWSIEALGAGRSDDQPPPFDEDPGPSDPGPDFGDTPF
jgi:hypothetical protein